MSLPNGSQPKSYELPLHGLSCTGLCVSVDGRSLVTVGEDWVSLAGNSLIGKSHRKSRSARWRCREIVCLLLLLKGCLDTERCTEAGIRADGFV